MSHQGKTVFVTGAAGGFGRAIAEHFLAEGANLVMCDIDKKLLADFNEKVAVPNADRVLALECDLTSEAALDDLFAQAEGKFGHLDYVVNSAGVMDKFDPVGELDMSFWEKVIAVNLKAPAMVMKRAVNGFMKHNTKGAIVNIASVAGFEPFAAGAAYTASKSGLIGLTKNTAKYYQTKGIRVNAIAAGGMNTNIFTHLGTAINQAGFQCMAGRYPGAAEGALPFCDLHKMAKLVAYLCSDDADMINGAVYTADAGMTV